MSNITEMVEDVLDFLSFWVGIVTAIVALIVLPFNASTVTLVIVALLLTLAGRIHQKVTALLIEFAELRRLRGGKARAREATLPTVNPDNL